MAQCLKPNRFGACRKCSTCLEKRQRQWLLRMLLEAMLYDTDKVTFLTLTYKEETLPKNVEDARHTVQLFFKRLRKTLSEVGTNIRYVMALESGNNNTQRFHWHAILFGLRFTTNNKEVLKKEWGNGFIDWKPATPGRMHYVLKYVVKKDGKFLMSKNPGIGSGMIEELQNLLNGLTEVERAKLKGNVMTMFGANHNGLTRIRIGQYDYPIHRFLKDRLQPPPLSVSYSNLLRINTQMIIGKANEQKIKDSFKQAITAEKISKPNRSPKQLHFRTYTPSVHAASTTGSASKKKSI